MGTIAATVRRTMTFMEQIKSAVQQVRLAIQEKANRIKNCAGKACFHDLLSRGLLQLAMLRPHPSVGPNDPAHCRRELWTRGHVGGRHDEYLTQYNLSQRCVEIDKARGWPGSE
ncbi:hypothetical protein ABZP36_016391 [Zizania latifolia]